MSIFDAEIDMSKKPIDFIDLSGVHEIVLKREKR